TEQATVEVVPEDEASEFTPNGEDQEDEYAINPAHESDKPVKRLSLLNAAVIVLKDAGPEHPMNCKEILEAILERQLWTPTDCKTPEQTLYGSIFREINTKEHPRIVKSNVKGKFVIAE
ncbi:MAG: winged helix-turn-helix domain-containing protein, partial [Lentisphaeria bacterium]|nr:winged helix-turn-helix domain-containing protein [Lentisphaeria bacterium]